MDTIHNQECQGIYWLKCVTVQIIYELMKSLYPQIRKQLKRCIGFELFNTIKSGKLFNTIKSGKMCFLELNLHHNKSLIL